MRRLSLCGVCLFLGILLTSCGGGSSRVLESISISPNPAVAPNGTVQLVATGTFSAAPVTVTPLTVNWSQSPCDGLCDVVGPNVIGPISVDNAGLANCNGSKGTFSVQAQSPKDPNLPPHTLGVPTVRGTANLICK